MKCKYCKYEWKPRKLKPVSCPKCKRRFDYNILNKIADNLLNNKGD